MNPQQAGSIVVGFNRPESSTAALRWAAHEAARRGIGVKVVHAGYYFMDPALESKPEISPEVLEQAGGLSEDIRRSTVEALKIVSAAEPGIAVSTVMRRVAPAKCLIELSESASMLVLGSHGESSVTGAVLGSISQTVAAHAHCPVIIVEETAEDRPVTRETVVVGIHSGDAGLAALRFACEEAVSRNATLTAVRAWGGTEWAASRVGYEGTILTEWRHLESQTLDSCVDKVHAQYPGLRVIKKISMEPIQTALMREARGAHLLVIGCHRREDHWLSRLGPIASWLLHHSPCPLAVVGAPRVSADREREDGQLSSV